MADQELELDVLRELLGEAEDVAALAKSEKSFMTAYEAFRSEDRKTFHTVLRRVGLTLRCHRICAWIRMKECVLVCFHLCGPPPERLDVNPRQLAEAIVRITSDEKLVRAFAAAIEKRDRAAFQRLIKREQLGPLCHAICHWLCFVRYRLVCRWICQLELRERPDFVLELQTAGQALARLLERKRVFDQAVAASKAGDAERLRGVLQGAGLALHCRFICEWFCSWRCLLVCFPLCRVFPVVKIDDPLREAFEFARVTRRLAGEPETLRRLSDAVGAGDAKKFAGLVRELKLERFCIQLCHWLCFVRCRRFCILVCPPIFNHPWFTHVGDFGIYADIDPSSGLTNKQQAGHGGPDYGFFGCLKLRGLCPKTSPAFPGAPMAYRFLFQESGGAATPITAGFVCEVLVGSRYISWDVDGTGLAPTLQSVRIRGASPSPDPTPPPGPPGTAWGFPPDHYVVPDGDGWIRVDQNALDDGYNGWLLGFASPVAFPGGDPAPGVAAGTAVPAGSQKNGKDVSIVFEATRVSQIGAGPPDYTNALAKARINNWGEVMLLDLLQFHSGGGNPCSPLSTDLDIEYTTDHELMAAWSIGMNTAASVSPAPTFPSGTGPRGGAGTDHHNISSWPTCSYAITLTSRRSLTDGLNDDTNKTIQKTFCIGARRTRP